MNYPRRFPLRASAALTALFALAVSAAPLRGVAAQESARRSSSGVNGKIAFQSTQGGDGFTNDIYVMDADGRRQTRLTDDPADDVFGLWSPQGDRIAFLSSRRGAGYEIYLMNADGSSQRPLRDASPVKTDGFVWSPDGTRLAYVLGGNVYVVAADGTAAPVDVSVNKPAGSTDGEPSWSPTGGQLVVRNSTPCGGCSDLHVVNASDGGGRIQLSTGPGFDAGPRWSPAGNLIAYEGDRSGRGIYVTAADGTGAETLVSGTVGSWGPAAWSPDGARLAFLAGLGDVYDVNADGSQLTPVSDVRSSSGSVFWSPDATMVGFHNGNADGWVDIFVVSADGSSRRAANYTKTRRADEFAYSWQKLATP